MGASLPAILAHTHLFKNSHQIVSIVLLDQMEDGRLNTGLCVRGPDSTVCVTWVGPPEAWFLY